MGLFPCKGGRQERGYPLSSSFLAREEGPVFWQVSPNISREDLISFKRIHRVSAVIFGIVAGPLPTVVVSSVCACGSVRSIWR